MLPETTNPSGDESDLLDFSFASLPTLTSPSLTASERRKTRELKRLAASHAFRCAEVDGRDPVAAARAAAAKIGGVAC